MIHPKFAWDNLNLLFGRGMVNDQQLLRQAFVPGGLTRATPTLSVSRPLGRALLKRYVKLRFRTILSQTAFSWPNSIRQKVFIEDHLGFSPSALSS